MMMENQTYVLGIDVGTQGLKAGVYTVDGSKIWAGSESYPTNYPSPGLSEQNPLDWWRAFQRVLSKSQSFIDLHMISAIAVCATSSTVLVVNQDGEPEHPAMMWNDTRAGQEVDSINDNPDLQVKDTLRYSGGKVSAEWMTPKTLWAKNQGLLKPGYRILEQLDWFNLKLTGSWVSSQCNATCKWNYVKGQGFTNGFFKAIQLEEFTDWWPTDVKAVGEQVGIISSKAAKETGLKEGVPVFQGGIDAHIGMLGIGATDLGEMSLIMGSSFVHLVHTENAVFEPSLWGPYPDAILPDSWLLEGGQLTCGSLTTWFLEQFYPGVSDAALKDVYQDLLKHALMINPGSNGLIIMDSWQGNRTPYRSLRAQGSIYGLTLAHTRFDIFRAILESVAYGTQNIIETYKRAGVPIHRIIASGGGAKNELWLQIVSDAIGISIEVAEEIEAGTKGCAVISSYGFGAYPTLVAASKKMTRTIKTYQPNIAHHEQYKKHYQTYLKLYEKLLPMMEDEKAYSPEEVIT
jgi:ribulose kinase